MKSAAAASSPARRRRAALVTPFTLFALLAIVAALGGCAAVGPNYQRPPVTPPDRMYGQSGPAAAASLADLPWWEIFQDPTLRALIEEALHNGYDVRIAAARVEESRARFGIAGSAFDPQIGYQGQAVRERFSKFQTAASSAAGGITADLLTANVNVSWEIDVWGRVRRLAESAKAQYLATEEARRGVTLSLVSEVATAYFDLRQLDEDLEIARRTTAAFQDTYDLFNRQLEGGIASALATSDAEAALAGEAAQVPALESQIVAKENQVARLLGRAPGPIARGAALGEQALRPEIPAGLPAALLLRRPDLRQAEQQLIAANADIGVARAAFFPEISLTGLLGGLSPDLARLFGQGRTWSLGGGVTGPLFKGGALRGQYRVAVAQWEQARLGYEQAVNNALGEVSTALLALQKLAESEKQRERAVRAYQEAVRLARLRYDSGLSAYFEVVNAIQQLLGAENALAQTRHDRLVALVNFYKALGGGWQVEATAEPPAPASP
ncbi:MAG TPA: efflux transporter outer membrane subunit [Thermoanaerobaculia bacterium]|nr:efflux transporter outer membrane subunit [Thermoanaerobaculia bacterium]